jgi:antitoxin (DNA-binding transcriptional repressor) of toxin-antitoxin stability system
VRFRKGRLSAYANGSARSHDVHERTANYGDLPLPFRTSSVARPYRGGGRQCCFQPFAEASVDGPRALSDNRIMTEISATDASKRFADMLDAVEHRGETFTVIRRGRAIATVAPARQTRLGALREFMRTHPADEAWERDLADVRRFVGSAPTTDPWTG